MSHHIIATPDMLDEVDPRDGSPVHYLVSSLDGVELGAVAKGVSDGTGPAPWLPSAAGIGGGPAAASLEAAAAWVAEHAHPRSAPGTDQEEAPMPDPDHPGDRSVAAPAPAEPDTTPSAPADDSSDASPATGDRSVTTGRSAAPGEAGDPDHPGDHPAAPGDSGGDFPEQPVVLSAHRLTVGGAVHVSEGGGVVVLHVGPLALVFDPETTPDRRDLVDVARRLHVAADVVKTKMSRTLPD